VFNDVSSWLCDHGSITVCYIKFVEQSNGNVKILIFVSLITGEQTQ